MSSNRKIEANRENGKLGGPKTPEGKVKSALNSIKHGLTGSTLLLTSESRPMYNDLLDAFVERFQPADEVEFEILMEMVAARWRLRRTWSIETAMIDLEMDDQEDDVAKDRGNIDELVRIALAFKSLAEGKGLSLLSRYESRLRRLYEKSLADLLQLQATRRDQTNPPSDPPSTPKPNQTNPAPIVEPPSSIGPSVRPRILACDPPLTPQLEQTNPTTHPKPPELHDNETSPL
jgi:hypothetical protein